MSKKRTTIIDTDSTTDTNKTTNSNKENNMNYKLFTDAQNEVTINWKWDETKSYADNLAAITKEVEEKKVNIFVTQIHGGENPYFVDEHSYESVSALGASVNYILHKTYAGVIGEEISTQKGCHVFAAGERFEFIVAMVKNKSAVWDLIPSKPTVGVFDPQWYPLVNRNGSVFLRRSMPTDMDQGDVNRQQRSHDYIDLLLERDLRIWVAPVRRLLASHLMSWLTPEKAAEFRRNGYDNANARKEVRSIATKHKLVGPDLITEEEVLGEPAVVVMMTVFKSRNTVNIADLMGQRVDIYMKPSSFSPCVKGMLVDRNSLETLAELANSGYSLKVCE